MNGDIRVDIQRFCRNLSAVPGRPGPARGARRVGPAAGAYREEVGEAQRRGQQPEPQVHSITGAATPHSTELDARIHRYLFSMAVRSICVVLVIVIDNPVRWVFAVLAVILPGVAVVMANAAGSKIRRAVPPVTPTGVSQISLGAHETLRDTGSSTGPGFGPSTGPGRNTPYEQRTEDSSERTP